VDARPADTPHRRPGLLKALEQRSFAAIPLPVTASSSSMRRLFAYARPDRRELGIAAFASVTNKFFDLLSPVLVGWAVDTAVGGAPGWVRGLVGTQRVAGLVVIAVATVVIFGGESFFQWLYQRTFQLVAQRVQHRVRADAYDRLQQLELAYFETTRTGELLSVLSDDVNQLERFLNSGINEILQVVVLAVIAGAILVGYSAPLTLIALVPLPLLILGSMRFQRHVAPHYKSVRAAVGTLVSRLENNVGGITVIKSFGTEAHELERVREESLSYLEANRGVITQSALLIPLLRMAIAMGFGAVLVVGGIFVTQGSMSPGVFAAFALMTERLLWPMTRMGQVLNDLERARASVDRIFQLLDRPVQVREPLTPTALPPPAGAIRFDQVRFRYAAEQEEILRGVSFSLQPGEHLGIVGATGAGKSTIVKLLLRLYDVTGGAIEIDGVDVRQAGGRAIRERMGLVPQEPFLFHGSVRENIAYGDFRADDAAIQRAARAAEAHEFIGNLPAGYQTLIGERGVKLSGGQRQRIALARAILKNPPILVLDEATSSVDTETEAAILRSLAAVGRNRTLLTIAHRLSTVRKAHKILVLENGHVQEHGTHESLLLAGGLYARLWRVQGGESDDLFGG